MGAGATALGRQEKCRRNAAGIPPGRLRAVLERNLSDVQRTATRKYVSPIEFAFCYARLRRKDETIRYLERAYQEQTPFLVHLRTIRTFILSIPIHVSRRLSRRWDCLQSEGVQSTRFCFQARWFVARCKKVHLALSAGPSHSQRRSLTSVNPLR